MTSAEYSNLLLQRLQIYFSCSDTAYRAWLVNFFGSIFNDPSVIVDESSYIGFVTLMEDEINYCAKRDLTMLDDVYNDSRFNTQYSLLENAFAQIGISLEMTKNADGPTSLIFTLPSGEQRVWDQLQTYYKYLYVNSRLRVTDQYLSEMMPYYVIDDHIVSYDEDALITNVAGNNTTWEYDADAHMVSIMGTGSLASAELWNHLGIGATTIRTFVIGAGVHRLCFDALNFTIGLTDVAADQIVVTVVDFHGETDVIVLDEGFCPNTDFQQIILYSDNAVLRTAIVAADGDVELHALSEWAP